VLARHTCEHRIDELLDICRELGLRMFPRNIPFDMAALVLCNIHTPAADQADHGASREIA
jgi:hypothetical protein